MRSMSRRLHALTLLIVLIAPAAFAANLDLTPLQRSLQFNFSFPGARSLGMGGAFIGRADDASAAEANPAGLTVIAKPEITLEVRDLDYSTDIPTGIFGSASAGVARAQSRRISPSFLSVVFPAGGLTLAAFYSRPLDFQQKFTLAQPSGVIGDGFFFGDLAGDSSLHYRAETFGLSAGWKIGGLSLGLGARREQLKLESSFADHDANGDFFGRIEGSESKMAYSGGLKWASSSENVSVGLVYKSGANYSVTECSPLSSTEHCSGANFPSPSSFEIPPQYGAGLSIRPTPGVTINADVVRIQYDRLLRHWEPADFCLAGDCTTPAGQLGFEINNATELHIGGEWAFPGARVPFALRAGWWRDPDHSVRYRGATNDSDPLVQAAELFSAQRYPGESAQNHVAFGIGYLNPSFEINAAYDHSSLAKTASISALKRF